MDAKKVKDPEPSATASPSGRIEIISMDPLEMELDFVGYDISIINAYRRITLAEVSM